MLAVPPAGPAGTFAYANSNYVLIGGDHRTYRRRAVEDGDGLRTVRTSRHHKWRVRRASRRTAVGRPTAGLTMAPTSPGSDNPLGMGPAGTVHMDADGLRTLPERVP